MYKLAKPFFIIVETPLHAGSGQDLGIVDMPIQRERHTDFPKIEGSGLKGSIREVFEERLMSQDDKKKIHLTFGYDNSEKDEKVREFFKDSTEFAGALGFTDARLLLFPVKSMKGVFAWVTCPKVLNRLKLDLQAAHFESPEMPTEKSTPRSCQLFVKDNKIALEEYTFQITKNEDDVCSQFAAWLSKHAIPQENEYSYWQGKMKKDIVVLPDDDFRDFVNLSTEVITRTKIDNVTGTVQPGALFTEEYLPSETIMYSLALSTPIFNKDKGVFTAKDGKKEEDLVMEFFEHGIPDVMQIGGNATIGKGIVRIVTWGNKHE